MKTSSYTAAGPLLLFASALCLLSCAAAAGDSEAVVRSLRRTKAHADFRALLQTSEGGCGCDIAELSSKQYATSCPDGRTSDGRLAYCNDCKSHLGDPSVSCMPSMALNVPQCTHSTCQGYHPESNYLPTQRATSGRDRTKGSCGWFKSGPWWKFWSWYKGCSSGYSCDSGTCTDDTRMEGESCDKSHKCIQPNEHSKQICYKDGKCHRLTDRVVRHRDVECGWYDNFSPWTPCNQHGCAYSTGDGSWRCNWDS